MKKINITTKQAAELKLVDFDQINEKIKQYHESHVIAVNQNILREKSDRAITFMASGGCYWGDTKKSYQYEDLVIRLYELKKFIETVTK